MKFRYIEGGGNGYVRKEPQNVRQEETHVHRPIVSLLREIEGKLKCLSFLHVPNQLLQNNKRMKQIYYGLGVRAGATDLIIPLQGGRTLWLELKFKGSYPTEDQKEFHEILRALGHIVEIITAENSTDAKLKLLDTLKKHGVNL